jgi:DNA topoisomerase-2
MDEKPIKIYQQINERWEVCVTASDGQPQQVSYVNSICTTKGGEHVKYIADQVAARLVEVIKKKDKGSTIKPKLVKNHLWIFVNATVANPAFDSQCKDTLTTRWQKFGDNKFLPKLDDKFLKKLEKCGIVDNILFFSKAKQMRDLARKGGGKKTKVTGIPKLDDANNAGGKHSGQCTLILTEGDSAKSLAIAGLSVVGRDNYGVFPLKGKPLNVRDAGHAQIMKNEEIQAIMKIMGLQANKKYEDAKTLRYGHILIMADQDHDGSHIKGLLMNFIHHYWPSLLNIPGFLQVSNNLVLFIYLFVLFRLLCLLLGMWEKKKKRKAKQKQYKGLIL